MANVTHLATRPATDGSSQLERLARSASRLELSTIPHETRAHAVQVVADTIGVMLAGGLAPEMVALATRAGDPLSSEAKGKAQLVTPGQSSTDPLAAAFVNASAGTIVELDEFVLPGAHATIHVVPAALAVAQTLGRSGADLLAAVLAGYEVVARLLQAYELDPRVQPHGYLPGIGAAVAAARLLEVDPGPPATIAASFPLLGLWEPSLEGATVHHTYAGVGAAIGLLAARLARAGFTGSQAALPIAYGEMAGQMKDPDALARPIDPEALSVEGVYIKLWGCCGRSYAAIDAVLSLGPLDPNAVCSVDVETVSDSLIVARQPQPNCLSARFSMQYAVAAAIVHGHVQPSAFGPDERTLALARRVNVQPALDLDDLGPMTDAARVVVKLADGSRSAETRDPAGYLRRPLAPDALREKFEALARDPATGTARVDYTRLLELESLTDLSHVLAP